MRRQSQEEAAEAARRRLELLGRELDQAGLRRVDDGDARLGDDLDEDAAAALPEPSTVAPAGRHARVSRPRSTRRLGSWVGDQVPETLRGRVGLDPGPVLLVFALVALAIAATAYVVLRTGGESEAVSNQPTLAKPADESPLLPSPAATGVSSKGEGDVTVDVAGKVRRPGITTLPAGSRVADALKKAGGPRGRVDLSALNLARVLVDGEQILVGRAAQPGGIAAGASTAAPDPTGGLVSLNTATLEQLETLPGVGPVTAQKILDWRGANGAFSSVDQLLDIDGIGDKTLAEIAPHVTL
jgi:competence protein ComEA